MNSRIRHRESRRDRIFKTLEQKHPLLSWLLRVLRYNSWFWVAGLGLVLLCSIGAVFVLKTWTVTPHGLQPVVRARGIDIFRARALRKSALKQEANGAGDEALQTWLMALANNPADAESLRGVLLHVSKAAPNERHAQLAQGFGGWLLKLRGTNSVDLALLAHAFEQQRLDQLLVAVLRGSAQTLSPDVKTSYLKALFTSGDTADFHLLWERVKTEPEVEKSKNLQLYYAAYLAGWGTQSENNKGSEVLKVAKLDPERAELAHRLQLAVSLRTLDAASYAASLDYLSKKSAVDLRDNMGYWKLLVGVGESDRAAKLIQENDKKPVSSAEAIDLAKTCFSAGLNEDAGEVLKTYSSLFPASESLWTSYTSWLVDQKHWDVLRSCALQLRSLDNPLHRSLGGYGHYLEGRAELGLGRRESADLAFEGLKHEAFENKSIAVLVAVNLLKVGYSEIANKILAALEPTSAADPNYWRLLSKTAYDLHDANLLRYAIEKGYELRPEDPSMLNNYAALLLSFREKPDVAIQLTLRLMGLYPGSASVRINHICALLQNKRVFEAERLLADIKSEDLKPMDISSYYMAVFELALERKDRVAALGASRHVDRTFLIGPDRVWFENALQTIASNN